VKPAPVQKQKIARAAAGAALLTLAVSCLTPGSLPGGAAAGTPTQDAQDKGGNDMRYALSDSDKQDADVIIEKNLRGCFDYFWNETAATAGEPGYGLTRDNTQPGSADFASIAATGYALAAYPVGVEKGWITREEGLERARGTLETFLTLDHYRGFFYHFFRISTAAPWHDSEVSTIDTALFLAGALASAQYFQGDVLALFEEDLRARGLDRPRQTQQPPLDGLPPHD